MHANVTTDRYGADMEFRVGEDGPASRVRVDFPADLHGVRAGASGRGQRFLKELSAVVRAEMGSAVFGVDLLADRMGLSRRQLLRRVREVTGLAPSEYIRSERLERGRELLALGHSTAEAAAAVGFHSASHFSRAFRRRYGRRPSRTG